MPMIISESETRSGSSQTSEATMPKRSTKIFPLQNGCGYRSCSSTFWMRSTRDLHNPPPGWHSIVCTPRSVLDPAPFATGARVDRTLCPVHSETIMGLFGPTDAGCGYRGCINLVDDTDGADHDRRQHVIIGRGLFTTPSDILRAKIDAFICDRHFQTLMDHLADLT